MFLQEEFPIKDNSPFHLLNFLLLIIYILAQGIFHLIKRRKASDESRPTIRALQVDLKDLETKVVQLDKDNDNQGIMINNKLDLIISQVDEQKSDMKELRKAHQDLNDRFIKLEAMFKPPRRR